MAMLPPSNELPVEIGEVEQELRKLVKRSFLEEQLNPERQFSFQPVVLEYLRYKASDQTEAHRQAINYYDQLKAKEESWKTIDDLKEYLEIFYHLCQLGEFDFAFYTIIPFDEFLMLHSYYTVQVDLFEQLLEAWQGTDAKENFNYVASLVFLSTAYHYLGYSQTSIKYSPQALAIAQEDGNRYVESLALTNLGLAYNALGEYHRAIEFYQKSLEIQRTIGDRKGEANSLGNLGKSYYFLRQYQQAIDFYQQSLEIQRAIGDRRKEANILQILAYAYNQCGRVQEVFAASYQAQLIRQELELPLEAMPYPKWIKSLIKYAQR